MKIYLAPLEGITNNIYRASQYKYFGGVDKYFTPFITPNDQGILNTKVMRDISPENNKGMNVVPQILTNSSEGFLTMCRSLAEYGYKEFNLNLGCPSGTVVSKGRGSGFLAYPQDLNKFLEAIFKSEYKISVKTRIGKENPEEFYRLLEIYNQYPMEELIIHPRTRTDMYKNSPNWQMFEYALENSKNKLCYNGDIFAKVDYKAFTRAFPTVDTIMIGRGLITNPNLANELKGGNKLTKEQLKEYYTTIFEDYTKILSGETPLLHKTKELWMYMLDAFEENTKLTKKLKKSKNIREFNSVTNEIFATSELI